MDGKQRLTIIISQSYTPRNSIIQHPMKQPTSVEKSFRQYRAI
jgi:hypothetical protein